MHLRLKAYILGSLIATLGAIQYAYETRQQFYPAVVFLSTNKFCIMILGNMGICLTLLLGRLTKSIFFGTLREFEVEILYENSRYAVTETCLALTIFREELSARVFVLFVSLLFCKAFHWLAQARVDHLEQTAMATRSAHIRLVALMLGLLMIDSSAVGACVSLWKGPSVLILFGFEYAILAAGVLSTFARYLLHVIDMRIEGTWHNKASYTFLLDFLTEVVRFVFYLIFFCIIFTYYGMPLHIIRDLWGCYRKLRRRLQAYNKYRQLTSNMNERFPDATPEQLETCDHTCIICRDHMDAGKMLPCSHIFHFQCLRMWLQHQQSCPTCRADIPSTMPSTPAANQQPPQQQQAPGAPQAPPVPGVAVIPPPAGAVAPAPPATGTPTPGVTANAPATTPTPPPLNAPPAPPSVPPVSRLVQVQPAQLNYTPAGQPQQQTTIYGNPIVPPPVGASAGATTFPSPTTAFPEGQFMLYRTVRPTSMQLSDEPVEPATEEVTLPEGSMLCSFEKHGVDWVKVVTLEGNSGWVRIAGVNFEPTVEVIGSPGSMPMVPLTPLAPGEEAAATTDDTLPPVTETVEDPYQPETEANLAKEGYEERKETAVPSESSNSVSGMDCPPSISTMRASLERVQDQIARLKEIASNEEKSSIEGLWERVQKISAEVVNLISSSHQSSSFEIKSEELEEHVSKLHDLEKDIMKVLNKTVPDQTTSEELESKS